MQKLHSEEVMSEFFHTIEQIVHADFAAIGELSATLVFFTLFFATFVSEDAACIAAGVLAGQGRISFELGLSACIAGIFAGDILLYWVGRAFGWRVLESKIFGRFISKRAVSESSAWLENKGASAVFLSRFVPGLRLPTYLAAGFLKTNFGKFAFYFIVAALVWTPILVGTAYVSGSFLSGGLILQAIAIFVLIKLVFHFRSWKNRQMFVGSLRRIINWEFWPIKVFYLPVVLYVFFLGLKYRSLTVFTCANPGIPAGGFVGESKDSIYAGLQEGSHSAPFLLKHILLRSNASVDENLIKSKQFIVDNTLSYPVVLKPDAGERGKGVTFIQDEAALVSTLQEIETDIVLQEFFDGVEASIFYYRFPDQPKGNIFSITEKNFPVVCGDGHSNLETLILRDRRAVCLARSYFIQNRDRLDSVPGNGTEIQIINIGTHSMGAIFLDGDWLKTKLLHEKIDIIARGFNGFYFGRFDLRAGSFEDFQNGANFRVIELNGVTSESTNIYDPKFSLIEAYKILFGQWKIAFEIGIQNRENGATPTSLRELASLVFQRVPTKESTSNEDRQVVDH